MKKSIVKEIFTRLKKQNSNPTTELKFKSTFELLLAVILSAQATDKSVNAATQILFKKANTPQQIFDMGEDLLKEYIKSIGLYRTKASNIIKTCKILLDKYDSKVPSEREDLESLPGVGRKTANVILNTAFNKNVIAVDTHILRVSNRLGLVNEKNPLRVEKLLMKIIPQEFIHNAHHWLILHGRYICQAKRPLCKQCILSDLCEYPFKTN